MRVSKKYIVGLICCVSLFLIVYFGLAFYIGSNSERDTKIQSDAILVLGARSYIRGEYNPCLEARVKHAVALYKEKYATKLLVSGGNDTEDKVNEAETMQKIAIENGVKKEDILLEKASASTYENFKFSQQILKKNNLTSVIVVTEPFHIPRASLIAKKHNYQFTVSPATQSPCWQPNHYLAKYFLKEPLAIFVYKLQNKL